MLYARPSTVTIDTGLNKSRVLRSASKLPVFAENHVTSGTFVVGVFELVETKRDQTATEITAET